MSLRQATISMLLQILTGLLLLLVLACCAELVIAAQTRSSRGGTVSGEQVAVSGEQEAVSGGQ